MGLVQCPDCKKEISDTATTCIGCGRSMLTGKDSIVVESVKDPVVVERKGGKYELIGTLLILASMGGCSVGLVSSNGGSWLGIGIVGFVIGVCIFIYGRFF